MIVYKSPVLHRDWHPPIAYVLGKQIPLDSRGGLDTTPILPVVILSRLERMRDGNLTV